MVAEIGRVLGTAARFSVVSPLMMRLAGLFIPSARASVEMLYEFTAPFVVASTRMEREFNLAATSIERGIERAVSWYRQRQAGRSTGVDIVRD